MKDGEEKKGAGVLERTAGDVARAGRGAGRSAVRAVRGFWWGFRQPFRGARFAYFSNPGLARIWIWLTDARVATLDRHAIDEMERGGPVTRCRDTGKPPRTEILIRPVCALRNTDFVT